MAGDFKKLACAPSPLSGDIDSLIKIS